MNKKGVVWVSTVLYILISLAIIGLVIAAVTPRINSAKDKATVEQTIVMLQDIDSTINRASQVQGTKLENDFKMSRGMLTIDPKKDTITWELNNSAYQYSEPGVKIKIGKIDALTTKALAGWNVMLMLNYSNLNITFNNQKTTTKILQPAEVPYKLWIENKGNNQIDITQG